MLRNHRQIWGLLSQAKWEQIMSGNVIVIASTDETLL